MRSCHGDFYEPVYLQNGFGAGYEYLLNSTNQSAKPTYLKMIFLPFNIVQFSFFISHASNALIDMEQILFSWESGYKSYLVAGILCKAFFKGDLPFITINSIEIASITIDGGLINLFVTVLDIASYADALLPILPNK